MPWDFKVIGGGFVRKDTPCNIKCRAMARTEKPARPVNRNARGLARFKLADRLAA